MLPRKKRLPLGKERMRPERTFSSQYFSLRLARNKKEYNRLGVIIATSAVKKSTRRNFWRRQFAGNIGRWPDMGQDILIVANSKLDGAVKKEIQKELTDILQGII